MSPTTLLLLKGLGLGVVFVASALFVSGGGESVGAWWRVRTRTYGSWIVDEFDAMFEAITIERAQAFITGMTAAGALIGFLMGNSLGSRIFFALFFGGMGYFLPRLFVLWRRRQRLDRIEDVRIVVDSILTLRETGGNLSETFDVVANTIVERKKVSGKIKSMTAQGMAQGFIMCLMPPGMLLLFSFIDPTYTEPLFGTLLGWVVLALVAGLDLMGFWAMLKIVSIDV